MSDRSILPDHLLPDRPSDACAACALLEPEISSVVPLDELLTAAVAAGMAIVMAGGGPAKHLCKRHQDGVGNNLNDAIEAAETAL